MSSLQITRLQKCRKGLLGFFGSVSFSCKYTIYSNYKWKMKRNLNVLKKGSALSRHVMFSVFISLKVVSQRKRKKIGDSVA